MTMQLCCRDVGLNCDFEPRGNTEEEVLHLSWRTAGQLIQVSTGEILLDDSTELKGDPDVMVRVGTRISAERVASTVRRGGVTTNFPTTE